MTILSFPFLSLIALSPLCPQFMGCKLTKDETIAESMENTDMSRKNNNGEGGGGVIPSASEIKSKVDKKMCLVRPTYN